MSIRTIVEFNHDYLHRLEDDESAMRQLIRALCDYHTPVKHACPPPDGIRILGTRHHSEILSLEVK